jgi:hypothetical protein
MAPKLDEYKKWQTHVGAIFFAMDIQIIPDAKTLTNSLGRSQEKTSQHISTVDVLLVSNFFWIH